MIRQLVVLGLVGLLATACNTRPEMIGNCPQPRFTGKAPDEIYNQANPFADSREAAKAGRELYQHSTARGKVACARCHGRDGDGVGPMSHMFDPPPRNFTCAKTIKGVPDGQLFWIIRNGSPDTSMPSFKELSDEQIWQVIVYIRRLANGNYDS